MNGYAWEGMPLCIHGYQFDCEQCQRKPNLLKWITETAQEVYNHMGPGHSENVYESAMAIEMTYLDPLYSVPVSRQVPVSLKYKGFTVGVGFVDILLSGLLLVELKAVTKIAPKDVLQVRKYLEAIDLDYGLLINFGNNLEIVEVERLDHGETTITED